MFFFSSKATVALVGLLAVSSSSSPFFSNGSFASAATVAEADAIEMDILATNKAIIMDSMYKHYESNMPAAKPKNRRLKGAARGERSLVMDASSTDIDVEITKCTAFVPGGPGRTGGTTEVDCSELTDDVCDVKVQYEYELTNTSAGPVLLNRRNGKGGKGGGDDDDDGKTIAIKFLSEAFNPGPSSTTCTNESVLVDSPLDGEDDQLLSPGESVLKITKQFSVNVCDCPSIVFGAGVTANTVRGNKKGKGKGNNQPTDFLASADVVKNEVGPSCQTFPLEGTLTENVRVSGSFDLSGGIDFKFWSFTSSSAGSYQFTTCVTKLKSNIGAGIGVVSNPRGLSAPDCNFEMDFLAIGGTSCPSGQVGEILTQTLEANTNYFILVGTRNPGDYVLSVSTK